MPAGLPSDPLSIKSFVKILKEKAILDYEYFFFNFAMINIKSIKSRASSEGEGIRCWEGIKRGYKCICNVLYFTFKFLRRKHVNSIKQNAVSYTHLRAHETVY